MIRRIAICTNQIPFTSGGAEAHVAGLHRALLEAGYQAEVVALPFKWYPPEQIMRSVLAWRLLDLSEADGQPIDLLIGMKFPAYTVTHPNKVLWIIHQHRSAYNLSGTPFDDLWTYPEGARVRDLIRHCDNQFIPTAKKVFANSQTVRNRLLAYNGIESETLYHPPPRSELLRAGEIGDYIFFPSRFEPQKRQELLIEAMRWVRTPVKAVLAGGGRALEDYRSLIKQYDLSARVQVKDFIEERELIELYAQALAVCYLPFDEDYGYVTLEAMLAARPVIVANDGGGAQELVEHGENGLVLEPDPQTIADALDMLYSDRARARRMGQRGREKILSMKLSWQHVVERLISAAGAASNESFNR